MSIQVLSAKSTRRLGRELGDPTITRAWVDNAVNHHVIRWVTWDHIHGWYDRRTGEHGHDIEPIRTIGAAAPDVHTVDCYDDYGSVLLELDPFNDDGRWPTLND